MPEDIPEESDPQRLAKMLQAGKPGRLWRKEELRSILKHQMTAPVKFDISTLEPGDSAKLETLVAAEGLLIRSFADLLFHPNPPVELLRMTKDFAKACSIHPDSPLPQEISKLFYFSSIAAAMVHCRERISELSNESLHESFDWLIAQNWLEESLRGLLKQAVDQLTANGVSGHE